MTGRSLVCQPLRFLVFASLALAATGVFARAVADKAELVGEALPEDVRGAIVEALPDEEAAGSVLEARRQAMRAVRIVRDGLNAHAYYAAEVEPRVTDDDPPRPQVQVVPGPRFTLSGVAVTLLDEATNRPSASDLVEATGLHVGALAEPTPILAAERLIVDALRAEGFRFADVTEREVIGDRDAGTLDVTYLVVSGPRIAFGAVRYSDEIRTRKSYLKQLEPFRAGEIYSPEALDTFNARLAETRLFDVSRAVIADTSVGTTEAGAEIRDVIVTLDERDRHTLGLGASLSTDQGFGLNAELTQRNLTGRGDALVADLTVAELERLLDLQWQRPNQFGYGRGLILSANLGREETDAFDREAFEVTGTIDVRPGGDLAYSFGGQLSLVRETARVTESADIVDERDVQLATVFGAATIDRADSLLDPRTGWRAAIRLEPTVAFGGAESQFLRTVGQVRAYLPLDEEKRTVVAGRVRAGTAFGASLADLPTDRRFFAGGGGSVRGYAYQAIGPRTPDGTPLGGRSLTEMSGEVRWQWRERIGLVAFVDAGSVSDDETFGVDELRTGAGLGVRYKTVAGPIRLDVGVPVDKTRFDDPFQIYISIGQAF